MNAKVILFLSLCALVLSQREDKFTIDPFTPDTPPITIQITPTMVFPFSQSTFTRDTGILGGERDLELTVQSGPNGRVLSTTVSEGQWVVATPAGASGFAYMQYDGLDGSSEIDFDGLGGVDFTAGGADSFRAMIETDIDTDYLFQVTDMSGRQGFALLEIPGQAGMLSYELRYSAFNNSVNFSDIGSFEILIQAFTDVDSVIELLAISGPVAPSPSPTPSPAATPSPGASPSPTPSPSPAPQGPRFTWYTFDDDDNGREPCEDERPKPDYFFSDDNILYYYFVGTFDATIYSLNSTTSGAPVVALSAVLVGLVTLLNF